MKTKSTIACNAALAGILLLSACADPVDPPQASFTLSSNIAHVGDSIHFTSTSEGAELYDWDFGDGNSSTQENPSHIYLEPGAYLATLKVTNDGGSNSANKNINILALTAGQWKRHVVDNDMSTGVSLDTADFDGDGDLDLVAPVFGQNKLVWYENLQGNWARHTIEANAPGVTFAYCLDADRDGLQDVVACIHHEASLVIYLNRNGSWEKHALDLEASNPDYFSLTDMNGDGKQDLLFAGGLYKGGDVVWYENDHPNWTCNMIEEGNTKYAVAMAIDVDGDGHMEVACTQTEDARLVLFKKDGAASWSKTLIDSTAGRVFVASPCDLNKDGKTDLVVSTGGPYYYGRTLYWYENQYPDWTRHTIDTDLDGGAFVSEVDMDGDEHPDLMASAYKSSELVWYEYVSGSWERNLIDDELYGPRQSMVLNVNGDLPPDLVLATENFVFYYEYVDL